MTSSLDASFAEYYTRYYRDQLGLPDWEARVASRMTEDQNILPAIEQVAQWINRPFARGQRILVVGAGTGAEYLALSRTGAEVYGIEPERSAVRLGRQRAAAVGLHPTRLLPGQAERLPFPDNAFDVVWCWTVIEHVQDVKASLVEMVRVSKPWGHIFIQTPDYRHFYEPHYKLMLPMMAPKWLIKALLKLYGRPTRFLDTLQLVNSRQLTAYFQNLPVVAFQVIQSWPAAWQPGATRDKLKKITRWIVEQFAIQRDQYWIVRKLDRPR